MEPEPRNEDSEGRKRRYPFDTSGTASASTSTDDTFPATYGKVQGYGRFRSPEFQYLMCGYLMLLCCANEFISDFTITIKDNRYTVFDDVCLKVTLLDGMEFTLLFKLNEISPQCNWPILWFDCLSGYINVVKNIRENNIVCILYTNSTSSFTENSAVCRRCPLRLEKYEEHDQFSFINFLINVEENKKKGIFSVKIDTYNAAEINKTPFYLFSNQENSDSLKVSIEKMLMNMSDTDIYSTFDAFIRNWWTGNFVLTKSEFVAKLTELMISPWILNISGEKHNNKTKYLTNCIKNFDVTIVESPDEDMISGVWQQADLFHKMSKVTSMTELMSTATNDSQVTQAVSTARKFGLTPLLSSDMYKVVISLSAQSRISKLLWYLDLAPLVVRVYKANTKQIRRALQLLESQIKRKSIVLVGSSQWEGRNTFRTLSNLVDKSPPELGFIIDNFYVSLQGRQKIPLKRLLQSNNNVAKCIDVQDLLKMTQTTFDIGKNVEIEPHYISKRISAYVIDNKKLGDYSKLADIVFIINCSKTFNFGNMPQVELADYLEHGQDKPNHVILSTEGKCTSFQFDKVCDICTRPVYLIQALNDEFSVLLLSGGNTQLFEEIKSDRRYIPEDKILKYFDNPLNFVSGDVGTDRSSFFCALTRQCPPDFWSVHVSLKECNSFFNEEHTHDELLNYFLQIEDSFHDVKASFLQSKKLYLFLDGLEEVAPQHLELLLSFIKYVSSEGVHVWLSSCPYLEEKVAETLKVIPLKIEQQGIKERKPNFMSFFNGFNFWNKLIPGKFYPLEHFVEEENGAALNRPSKDGKTVFHYAMIAKNPNTEIVDSLLKVGVPMDKDSQGLTPLELARKVGNSAIVDEVDKTSTDLNSKMATTDLCSSVPQKIS